MTLLAIKEQLKYSWEYLLKITFVCSRAISITERSASGLTAIISSCAAFDNYVKRNYDL